MAQLIKLRDCISRYETDIYHYVPEFIRLKRRQWERAKARWEAERDGGARTDGATEMEEDWLDQPSWWERLFRRRRADEAADEPPAASPGAATLDELKRQFLEEMFALQLRWASSTVGHASSFDESLYSDETLKYLLQRFPDTHLCFYRPVAIVGRAAVELDTVVVTPTAAWCLVFVEGARDNIIIASTGRFWVERAGAVARKRVSPVASLRRTVRVVADIFEKEGIDWPLHPVLLNRYGYIDSGGLFPFVHYIDKRNYDEWFSRLRRSPLPLRHGQLKAAAALLRHCASFYDERLAWADSEEGGP
ncbi:nuclease-related domain-containing protein [Caldibacillus thermoamylovorans]